MSIIMVAVPRAILILYACCRLPPGAAALAVPRAGRGRRRARCPTLRPAAPSDDIDARSGRREGSAGVGAAPPSDRRAFLAAAAAAGALSTATACCGAPSAANAIDNPLNLKGTFWETGQLYEKSKTIAEEDGDFLSVLESSREAFRSPALLDAITDGNYGAASRLLRGGLISESRMRIAANALMDSIPEEDDDAIYKSSEYFRVFLRQLDVLDAEVEAASRPLISGDPRMKIGISVKGEGGMGGGDPRIEILSRLGEAEDALGLFLKTIKGAGVS